MPATSLTEAFPPEVLRFGFGKMQGLRKYQRFATRCLREAAFLLILASERFLAKWPRSGKGSQRRRRRDKLNITFEVPRQTAATKARTRLVAINQTQHDGHPHPMGARTCHPYSCQYPAKPVRLAPAPAMGSRASPDMVARLPAVIRPHRVAQVEC